ncbi:MAG: GAF and ANTAR domain-containing protein [Actinomycetota bacterium]|nr:GAF and ANTAR domain-containing protein [Actinomycetota bacterium]
MSQDESSPADSVGILAQYLLGDDTLGDTLTRIVALARDALPADLAGITTIVEGSPSTAVFTDDAAPRIDAHQYVGGSGPCVEAFRMQATIRIDNVPEDQRWPQFTEAAAEFGVRSTLSLPLSARGEPLGALNLYARATHAFAAPEEQLGERFASQASVVLANAQAYTEARDLCENLRQALASRSTIDYAIGIVMAGAGQDPDEAFQVLVRASQREHRKLRTIAAELVERTARRSPPSP